MNGCLLVQQWHPDRRTRTPSLLGEAKCKFQQIQIKAYSGLNDPLDEKEEEEDDDDDDDEECTKLFDPNQSMNLLHNLHE
ncbi:hypothetical protein BDE02_08G116400 [Populus trichocarpa]|nr:hypothetical protein BDE02_08G116400 [Populus trichocarpa]